MPSPIDKYTVRRQGFALCVVPLRSKARVVEVFDLELTIPDGQGYAMLLRRGKSLAHMRTASMLIEVGGVARLSRDIAKRLVHRLHRDLHGPVVVPKTAPFNPADFDRFSREQDEARARVVEWTRIVTEMLEEALGVLED